MKISEIVLRIGGCLAAGGEGETEGVYVGDFLSRVMGRAPENCLWITVMNNLNVAGVAVLASVKAVALCEDVQPQPALVEKCREEGISLITTPLSAYECCKRL